MPSLFDPIHLGAIRAPNRILMAPLDARPRHRKAHVPTPIMAELLRPARLRRPDHLRGDRHQPAGPRLGLCPPASGPTSRSRRGSPIVEAVHQAGGRIVSQLWHMGRLVHPDFHGGAQPVSASPATRPRPCPHLSRRVKDYVEPLARLARWTRSPGMLDDYRRAAAQRDPRRLRRGAGPRRQRLSDRPPSCATIRTSATDEYGGPIPNRIRLLGEVTRAVADDGGRGAHRRPPLPNGMVQGVNDSNPEPLFAARGRAPRRDRHRLPRDARAAPRRHPRHAGSSPGPPGDAQGVPRPLILNADYRGDDAQAALDAGEADAIAFGRTFLANPDLPRRLRESAAQHAGRGHLLHPGREGLYSIIPRWQVRGRLIRLRLPGAERRARHASALCPQASTRHSASGAGRVTGPRLTEPSRSASRMEAMFSGSMVWMISVQPSASTA